MKMGPIMVFQIKSAATLRIADVSVDVPFADAHVANWQRNRRFELEHAARFDEQSTVPRYCICSCINAGHDKLEVTNHDFVVDAHDSVLAQNVALFLHL